MSTYDPYNPLDKSNITESLVRTMLSQQCVPLPPPAPFLGAGVYAIYYRGAFPAYAALARVNQSGCEMPIYVGKAVPKGGRTGVSVDPAAKSQSLYDRLREHAGSISAATSNLRLEDFSCRYRVIEELFIELAERALIQLYRPLWNGFLTGFGNHKVGEGRPNTKRSRWDTVHTGREWAASLKENKLTEEECLRKCADWLAIEAKGDINELPIPATPEETEDEEESEEGEQ